MADPRKVAVYCQGYLTSSAANELAAGTFGTVIVPYHDAGDEMLRQNIQRMDGKNVLSLVVEFDCNMLRESGTATADIDRYVEHAASEDCDEFPLRTRVLQVKPAQDPVGRAGKIVLYEGSFDSSTGVAFEFIGFHKKATRIAKALRLNDQHTRNGRHDYFHVSLSEQHG